MKKTFIIFSFICFGFVGFSQDVIEEQIPYTNNTLQQADVLPIEGTYQIIVENKNISVNIPTKTLYQVNNKRHFEKIIYIEVDKNVKIKILPFNSIRANSFIPLKMYSYEN